MKTKDLIEMGFKNLWRRKLRTFLTILGVIIGTNSIVVMISIGIGFSNSFKDEIASMGSLTTITVSKSYDSNSNGKKTKLDDRALQSLKGLNGVEAVMPIIEDNLTLINGKFLASVNVKGLSPEDMEKFDFKVEEGNLLAKNDKMGVVFGASIKDFFYNPKSNKEANIDLMNDKMKLSFDEDYENRNKAKDIKFKSIGVLEEGDMSNDYSIFMSLTDLKEIQNLKYKANPDLLKEAKKSDPYNSILVKVGDISQVENIQNQIKDLGFDAYSLNDMLEGMKKTSNMIQAMLGGIGAVSLIVAAIGITNTMIMSIYERTREIGVMKVIGATLDDIQSLFLFESAMIGLSGGILGLLTSYLISGLINLLASSAGEFGISKLSVIPIWLGFASIIFSTFIGVLSGYYPAKKAMSLSALEAIKTE